MFNEREGVVEFSTPDEKNRGRPPLEPAPSRLSSTPARSPPRVWEAGSRVTPPARTAMAAPALTALRPVVAVRSLSDDFVEFSLTGVDDAFANALRRVMIAEV